jgi:hypothetical protein
VPDDLAIHLVLDNYATHKNQRSTRLSQEQVGGREVEVEPGVAQQPAVDTLRSSPS